MANKRKINEVGHIKSFFSGVAKVIGLPHVFLHETLLDENGKKVAVVIGFDENSVEALFFKENFDLDRPLFRSGHIFSISISEGYLGRVINGVGEPIDGLGIVSGDEKPVFNLAPKIIDRDPVETPLSTGIKIIDSTLPLGRGQRELIIGDRKLGKSTLAIDIVLNLIDSPKPVYCIYVVCGQPKRKVDFLISMMESRNSLVYSAIVSATSTSSFAELYLAPFVGCALGEYFRDIGKDALVIYDDLTQHAKAYRDIALLFERAPGREAYPGDIFSLHANLLERAAKLNKDKGGGSLTALPILETEEDDITAFIPTNIISITDGQIFLERPLFQKGFLPAINIELSVSRVGSQAQPKILKDVTSGIRLTLAQHRELQKLGQLETAKSESAVQGLKRGDIMLESLKQDKHSNVTWQEQSIMFYSIQHGFFDDIKKEDFRKVEKLFMDVLHNRYASLLAELENNGFNQKFSKKIENMVTDFKKEFVK